MGKPSIYNASGRKCSTSKLVSSKMPHSKRQALAEIINSPQKQNIKKKNDDISLIVIASDFNDNVLSDDPPMPPLPPPIEVIVDPRSSVQPLFSVDEIISTSVLA